VLEWFRKHPASYLLVPDSDEAGEGWTRTLVAAIQEGEGRVAIAQPPDGKDPDEALLAGWWPPGV
jgi:DNA primase